MRGRQLNYVSSGPVNEHQAAVLEGVAIWAAYYRSNIYRFVEDYFHITLKLFQIILLVMMDVAATFVFIGSRGLGKTFLSAVYVAARAVLYPGSKICVSSGTRGQAANIIEKIMQEIVPRSPELANEIDMGQTQLNGTNMILQFKNGSYVKVVTASDTGRGNRAHILLLDEFRMIKKDVITTILKKFQATPRHPGFMDLPEYHGKKEYQERNKTLYLSSAYYKDHWSYTRCKDSCRLMLSEGGANFVCGLPYQLAIEEGLLMEEEVLEQMSESDFSEVKWSINISVLLKLIEPMPKGCAVDYGANGGTLTCDEQKTIPCYINYTYLIGIVFMSYRVYKYTNNINHKVYIGQTRLELKDRAQSNGNNYKECRKFHAAIKEFGWENFTGEVLEDGLTQEEAGERERFYIQQYNSTDDRYGYNIAEGGPNSKMSEESKEIISCKAKERYQDPTKNPMYGKSHSDESKELMSKIKRGALNPMYGKKWNETQRARCSTKGKKLNLSPERLAEMSKWATELGHKNAKAIRCIEDDLTFHSLSDAAEHYAVNPATLCGQLNGRQKTCRGRHFEYVS